MAIETLPRQPDRSMPLLAVIVGVLLYGQFLHKPVHIDDTNFLRLAEGAAADFRRPHLVPINWLGETVPAFDVLSNPPGIAWWLAPVLNAPLWLQHLWMLVWLLPTAWGARELGKYFCQDDGTSSVWVLMTCPVVVLSAHSFFPDLPLLACTVAGIGGMVSGKGWKELWALVAGSAFLFRYSGVLLIAVVVIVAWRQLKWRGVVRCWPAVIPLIALAVNDYLVYGKWHLLAMFAFQNDGQHKTYEHIPHNLVAAVAMLGGACLLPVLVWQRGTIHAAILGVWIGFNAAFFSQQTIAQGIPTVIFTAAGASALYLLVGQKSRDVSLSLWASLGLVLLGTSRFAATRYWIPFLPAFVLLGLRCRRDTRSFELAIAANVLVSLGLAIDDFEFADSLRQAAVHVSGISKTGHFSGHWGWQYYLEKNGWVALEPQDLPPGYLAAPTTADPQPPSKSACLLNVTSFQIPDRWPGPRVHSLSARGAYHAGGKGMYAPWVFSNEPYDTIRIFRGCDQRSTAAIPAKQREGS